MPDRGTLPTLRVPLDAFFVKTKDERTYVEPILDDGTGPTLTCWPAAPVVAESAGAAKALFLREYAGRSSSGVESDDYLNLRVSRIAKGVALERGVHADDRSLWALAGW